MRDTTSALGLLLTNAELRARYGEAPEACVDALDVAPDSRPVLLALDFEELSHQARGLIAKRCKAVAGILPMTFAQLAGAARESFGTYADTYWPSGHRRHLDDAIGFGHYLRGIGSSALAREEWNRVRFSRASRRFGIYWAPDHREYDRRRPALQILCRTGDGPPREVSIAVL